MKTYRGKQFKAIQLTEENIDEVLGVVKGNLVHVGYQRDKVDGMHIRNFVGEIRFVNIGDYISINPDGTLTEWEKEWFEKAHDLVKEQGFISYNEAIKLQQSITDTTIKLLGGTASNAYANSNLLKDVYEDIRNQIKRQFRVSNLYQIPKQKYNLAIAIIENHILPIWLAEEIYKCNNDIYAKVAASETYKSFFS